MSRSPFDGGILRLFLGAGCALRFFSRCFLTRRRFNRADSWGCLNLSRILDLLAGTRTTASFGLLLRSRLDGLWEQPPRKPAGQPWAQLPGRFRPSLQSRHRHDRACLDLRGGRGEAWSLPHRPMPAARPLLPRPAARLPALRRQFQEARRLRPLPFRRHGGGCDRRDAGGAGACCCDRCRPQTVLRWPRLPLLPLPHRLRADILSSSTSTGWAAGRSFGCGRGPELSTVIRAPSNVSSMTISTVTP